MATADIRDRQIRVREWWLEHKMHPPYLTFTRTQPDPRLENWVDMQARIAAHDDGSILADDTKWKVIEAQLENTPLWLARYLNWGTIQPDALLTRYHQVYEKADKSVHLKASTAITDDITVDQLELYEWLNIIGGYKGFKTTNPPLPTQATPTAPRGESNAAWRDRMQGIVAECAQNFEIAYGGLTPQLYTHGADSITAHLTSVMADRLANMSVHSRLAIGFLWKRITWSLGFDERKKVTEADILTLQRNMATPRKIKQFFHKHVIEDWKLRRGDSSNTRLNSRRVHLWNADFTIGKLLLDVNAKHTQNGVLQDLNAKAEFFTTMTRDYQQAAKHL